MLIVHLFVSHAHVNLYHFFSLPPGVVGWLWLLLVALPGLFCLPLNDSQCQNDLYKPMLTSYTQIILRFN